MIGFINGLSNLCEKFNPQKVIVVWESGGNIKRRNIDPNYKGGRRPPKLNRYYEDEIPSTIENHTMQVKILVKALECLPIHQLYLQGCEADDVLGYIGLYCLRKSDIILVSSDKDFHQLITERVKQWSPGQKCLIDKQEVLKKFGVSPQNFVSARVFVGDSSDKIQGAKGVGFKTLLKFFPKLANDEFVSYEEIIDEANSLIQTDKKYQKNKALLEIANFKENASKNWKLMYLDTSRINNEHVNKINWGLENPCQTNKMNLLRLFHANGLEKFNIDRYFSTINSIKMNWESK